MEKSVCSQVPVYKQSIEGFLLQKSKQLQVKIIKS